MFYVEHLFLYLINLHDDDCYFAGEKREEKKIFVQMKFLADFAYALVKSFRHREHEAAHDATRI